MSETRQGTLRWTTRKDRTRSFLISWTTKKGASQNTPPRQGVLASDLQTAADNDIAVDYELSPDGSYPINIRRAGTPWVPRAAAPDARPVTRPGSPAGAARVGHFHNPYNFIPAVESKPHPDLGRHRPVGHKAWHQDCFSGRLKIAIELVTPLLVPDASRARKETNGHTILPLLTEPDEHTPKLPVTSFKGALRSAYEAITNSRLGIFQGHDTPLGRRMEAGEGLAMVPARLDELGRLELWMGTLNPRNEGEFENNRPHDRRPPGNVMYAAWLRHYHRGGRSRSGPAYDRDALKYPDGTYPQHGDAVVCWLRKAQKLNAQGQARFSYWRVEAMEKGHDPAALPPESALGNPPADFGNSHRLVAGERPMRALGFVSVTNQNIGNKHDERVFFVPAGQRPYMAPTTKEQIEGWCAAWKHLVADYKEKAQKIIDRRNRERMPLDTYESRDIGKTALSRHICASGARELRPGDLCFVRIDAQGRIAGLYPVMISREVAKITPLHFLPEDLWPAVSLDTLSPADRVFGWVDQSGGVRKDEKRAYKGQLRIVSLAYAGSSGPALTRFESPLPLAILSNPKPEQARFYVAADKKGNPQKSDIGRDEASYDHGITTKTQTRKGLRGRKVYPHHADLPEGYWDGPAAWRGARERPDQPQQVGGIFREYVRIAEDAAVQRDDQNRSIEGWVNPGVRFEGEIDVVNLSKVEVGALLYLLSLPDGCYFRLGGGKPLGFGSARLTLADLDLKDGQSIKKDLLALLPESPSTKDAVPASERLLQFVQAYRNAMQAAYGDGHDFSEIPLIKAFLTAAGGFADGKPVHYPRAAPADWDGRARVPPNPEGKNYEWFAANDRTARFDSGPRQSLDPLWSPTGLTMLASRGDLRGSAPRTGPPRARPYQSQGLRPR
jgi:CRISPR-associated protein (TIGR03986 family)